MKCLRVHDRQHGREAERHDVTHRRQHEVERLKLVLELAYPDRERFAIEETHPSNGR